MEKENRNSFKMMPFGRPPARPRPKGKYDFITSFYYDEFKWDMLKSTSMFLLGIYVAREMKGVDFTAP